MALRFFRARPGASLNWPFDRMFDGSGIVHSRRSGDKKFVSVACNLEIVWLGELGIVRSRCLIGQVQGVGIFGVPRLWERRDTV